MKKLNPYALVVKKYARLTNVRRKNARDVISKKRRGEKVSEKELAKAAGILGIKLRTYKEYKAEKAQKKEALKALKEKVAAAKAKRAETKAAKVKGLAKKTAKAAKK